MSLPSTKTAFFYWLLLVFLLSACTPRQATIQLPEPLRDSNPNALQSGTLVESVEVPVQEQTGFSPTPTPPAGPAIVVTNVETSGLPRFRTRQPIEINVEGLPLPAFINEVFGNVLQLAFQLDPALQKKDDLVTLRIPEPQTPAQLYQVIIDMLEQYGVGVIRKNDLLQLVPVKKAEQEEPPLLITGSTLPEVPASHRTVFQFIPLSVVSHTDVSMLLHGLNKSGQLKISENPTRNAILLSGPPAIVRQALEAIRFLDQPLMRGKYSLRVEPVFMNAKQLADELEKVLKTEGYAVSRGAPRVSTSTVLLPIEPTNSLIIFASSRKTLEHIEHWVRSLDKPGRFKDEQGLFFYAVQNVSAETLAEVIEPLLDASGVVLNAGNQAELNNNGDKKNRKNRAIAGNTATVGGNQSGRLVVDPLRNALLFQGRAAEWAKLLPILKEMDKPSKLVLVEVTIAELSLDDSEEFGVEWKAAGINFGDLKGTLSTLGNLGLGNTKGLNFTLVNSLGETRALLNAFADNKRINVLSSPRLMVKSGESANINIGNEVPIQTNTKIDPTGEQIDGNTSYLRQIQYRKTGIILNVKPVVHAGNRIDLEISQTISNAIPTDTSSIDSPTIQNRSLQTSLSLSDGGSVLLGGLISETQTEATTGIPLLSDVPLLGSLFRVDSTKRERLNLIMLIVPYVINNDYEAREISKTFRDGVMQRFDYSSKQTDLPEDNHDGDGEKASPAAGQ